MSRELPREEKATIRKLVTKWCANHLACLLSELDQGELEKFEAVIDSGEHMFGKCWTGAYCRYFREAVLPLDPVLEAALTQDGPAPETRICPVCGRVFLPDRRTRYCSSACAKAARLKKQRGYMRKYRG